MTIRLSGALPDGERNGLEAIAHALVSDPERVHVAVVLLDTASLKTTTDTGDVVPTARIRAIEPISSHDTDAAEMRRLLRRAHERRTGQVELPLDLEQEFDAIDLSTRSTPRHTNDNADNADNADDGNGPGNGGDGAGGDW